MLIHLNETEGAFREMVLLLKLRKRMLQKINELSKNQKAYIPDSQIALFPKYIIVK
jgi:hypothetical protein